MIDLINRAFRKLYKILKGEKSYYVSKVDNKAPWILISYIPFALYLKSEKSLNKHQALREMKEILKVLNELGYNVYVLPFDNNRSLPNIDFKIIFGLEPVFEKACKKYPNTIKVYYATGAYHLHQTSMAKNLTDAFNIKYDAHIPYRCVVAPHNSPELADMILQIGTTYTLDTYPKELRGKIKLIHQSTQPVPTLTEFKYAQENEYAYMLSTGTILKGFEPVVRFFNKHQELKLNVFGKIEDDVLQVLEEYISPNIIIHGFVDLGSDSFLDIVSRCNFQVSPSGSEGCPGAVLNLMKNGLIPIVSRWAAVDDIDQLGYLLDDISEDSLEKAFKWTQRLDIKEIERLKQSCGQYIKANYSLSIFSQEFKCFFNSIAIDA